MNILIIEDEQPAADKLEQMILRHQSSHKIVGKIRSVQDAIDWFRHHESPDLLFMDIHLLDGTCFDILDEVKPDSPVIFTTAYENYAIEAFQLHSIDYLIKPVSFGRLQQAFQKLVDMQGSLGQSKQAVDTIDRLLTAVGKREYKKRFLVKFGSRLLTIFTDEINYFFSEDRVTFLMTNEGSKYAVSSTLDELEQQLDPSDFFRINRKMIIHIKSIKAVHKYFKGKVKVELLQNSLVEDTIVSSRRVADFQTWLGQ